MTHCKTLTTPGIDLLLKCASLYLLPTIIFILGFQRLIDYLDVPQALQLNAYLAHGLPILLGVSVLPSYASTRIFWREFKNRREAARLGARPVPKLRGKWLANIDFLYAMNKRVESGYPDDSLTDLVAKYGPVADFYVLWRHLMFTTSPEYIKIILATDFANYEKGEEFNSVVASLLGNGVFSSDGDMWKFHRSMTRPFFSRDRISHFDLFDRHADAVIAKIKERARAGIAMDFQDLMGRFTLDSTTEFLFGACVNSLQVETPFLLSEHLPSTLKRGERACAE
ncbi:cytochrome P450 [Pleurotus eryngii]|uniref:Cytochrome P450 n=1 Tax=Pleurotus eryngii TaxID=5323 RepID=A0A9P5ZSD3_PLEER|nr:cytochrome P450 [Pleurotus eryngii]